MLILTRAKDQMILIGDDVVVTVVEIRGDRVRLGVAAPIETRVDRSEVRDRPDYEPGRIARGGRAAR